MEGAMVRACKSPWQDHVKAYGDRMAKVMANKVHGKSMGKLMAGACKS